MPQKQKIKKISILSIVMLLFAAITVFGLSPLSNTFKSNVNTSKASAQEPTDINSDNVVNIFDLSILLANWNATGSNSSDVNGDFVVNIFDLSMLLSKWGVVENLGNGFITVSGKDFMLNGSKFKFIGFNAYGMAGCYSGTPWTTTQLDAYFSNLPSNGVTRLWAFRSYGTEPIQAILTEAAKYNQHVILTLGDNNSACGETDGAVNGAHSGKTLEFYQSGWKNEYLTWVNTIVPMFKDDPSIMMWDIANEPGQAGVRPPADVMQAYIKGASDAVRANDSNHLITVGSNTVGNYGGLANYIAAHNVPNIDALSFHDYSYQYEGGALVSANFNNVKLAAQQLSKPFYGGEAGVPSGDTCNDVAGTTLSLDSRLTFLMGKTNSYLSDSGGASGVMLWEYEPYKANWVANCAYEIYQTDPLVDAVKNYVVP